MGDSVIYGDGGPWAVVSSSIQQQYIDYWNAGGIVTDNFKPHNPKTRGSMNDHDFTDADMDAIVTPGTSINTNFNQWLDAYANFDKVLQVRLLSVLFMK